MEKLLCRFKIIDDQICLCKIGEQSVDHIIYECKLLTKERAELVKSVGHWPVSKKQTYKYISQTILKFHRFNRLSEVA
mgnify:CR=1 FL=1